MLVSTQKGEAQLEVKIYTKPGCPYCAKAKDYYNERKIPFQEFNAQDNLEFRKEMLAISKGDPTVPVIVEDGRLKQIGWEGLG
jgi:glutaredoxin